MKSLGQGGTNAQCSAFVAANARVPSKSFAFLASLRRPDGSYRYSKQFVTTPVWVTAQVLPALHRRAFPLPSPPQGG